MDSKDIALAFTAKTSKAENVVEFYKDYQKNLEELQKYKLDNPPKGKIPTSSGAR